LRECKSARGCKETKSTIHSKFWLTKCSLSGTHSQSIIPSISALTPRLLWVCISEFVKFKAVWPTVGMFTERVLKEETKKLSEPSIPGILGAS